MNSQENIESFLNDNKKLLADYLSARLKIYKLKFIALFSRSAGHIVWFIISLFLLFLFLVFLGLIAGFWFSDLTGSYTRGFGLAALVILLILIAVALLRKILFINPIIRIIIKSLPPDKPAENKSYDL